MVDWRPVPRLIMATPGWMACCRMNEPTARCHVLPFKVEMINLPRGLSGMGIMGPVREWISSSSWIDMRLGASFLFVPKAEWLLGGREFCSMLRHLNVRRRGLVEGVWFFV